MLTSVRSFRAVLRLKAFDTDTPEGRSKERYRRAALTTGTSIVARALGIFTGLAWIRLSISFLGKERYGLWMAVGSIVNWANLADLGLARGMQNHLSHANGTDDRDLAARYVSTGLSTLTVVAGTLALLFLPVLFLVPWTAVLNVENPALVQETRAVVGAVVACFLLQFPLSLVPTIYAAYQRGYIAAVFEIAGSVVSLVTLVAVTKSELSLPWLIVATSGVATAMTVVNFGYAIHNMPWLRPRLSLVSRATLRALASTSLALFVFQIGALLVNETQSLIIAQRLGLPRVAEWAVFMRVHLLPAIFLQLIDAPLIPAFREAYVRGEHEWLRKAFWRITRIKMAVAIVASGLYLALGNRAAAILGGESIAFDANMWAGSGLLLIVSAWNGSFNDLMIAVDRLRPLVITVFINGLLTPLLSYFLAPKWGLLGVLVATPVFSLIVSAWLLPWLCRDVIACRAFPGERQR
ncbi:MAG TPA: lipopolysaccharide biosynthesis protein [Polyangiaceae bacterium]|nr:lipopolysaccharide biosynthesis protein [Polyangiaceae bacterium]